MSIFTRKEREKADKRALILDAARKIFLVKGYEGTSIRNIAEEIEHSPGTIYLYFRDKDEIFHALHEEGFGRMLQKMEPLRFVSEPFERLKALGRVYLEFAKDNRDYYDLMFVTESPLKHEKEEGKWIMGDRTLDALKQVIRECQQTGRFEGKDVDYLSFIIWSGVHGMATLYTRDRCISYEQNPEDLMKNGFNYFVEMLGKI